MWQKAFKAITEDNYDWIHKNHIDFKSFFKSENISPSGHLSSEAQSFHAENGIFKMYVGSEYHGLVLPLHQGAKWIENAARLDGNWGWLLAIGVGGAFFVDYMDSETATVFYSPKNALVAGSGTPNGTTEKVDGGWKISGRWNFCSGSHQASMLTGVANFDGDIKAFVIDQNKAKIIETWNVIGLQLTCSHTYVLEDAFIPENQLFDLTTVPRSSKYPLSKYPFLAFAQVCFAPVIAGITQSIFDEAQLIFDQKKSIRNSKQPDRVRTIQEKINTFTEQHNKLQNTFYDVVEKSWLLLINDESVNDKEVEQAALSWATFCYESVAQLLPYLGMMVLQKDHPIQLMWQNLQTGYQHSSLR